MHKKRGNVSICMVSMGFPPDYTGAGRQALTLAKELVQKVSLFVICPNDGSPTYVDDFHGVRVFRLRTAGRGKGLTFQKLTFGFHLLWFLLKARRSYDISHCIGASFILLPCVAIAKLLGKKTCVKLTLAGEHGDDPQAIKRRPFGWLTFHALRKTDAIICVSKQLTALCEQSGINRVRLLNIPNGVDTTLLAPARQWEKRDIRARLQIPADSVVLTAVGMVERRKRVDLALKAMPFVLQQCPSLLFLIIGPQDNCDMAYLEHLRGIAQSENLGGNVRFMGNLDFLRVVQCLKASDIFIFASTHEGLPNALMEAMSCGLACIAASTPPVDQLVCPGQDGIVIKDPEPASLALEILRLINDKNLAIRLGSRAREKMIGLYDITGVAQEYIGAYRKLVQR